jgi:flagellar motor switch protein FliM
MGSKTFTTTGSGTTAPAAGGLISEEEAAALLEKKAARPGEARPLDLVRLRLASGRLPLLETLHQSFVGIFGKALSALLKRELQVSLQRIETQKTADYFATLKLPTSLDVVAVKSLKGLALFVIDPGLIFVMVDSFYGGSGRGAQRDSQRPPTPAELRFAQLVLKQMFADLKQAWAPVAPLEFELIKHESDPAFVNIAAPGENLLVSRFLIELTGGTGSIDFVMPEAMFEPLRETIRLANGAARQEAGADWRPALSEHLQDAALEVCGVLAETRINLRELTGLKPGDIIPMDPPGPAALVIDGVPVYGGKFGISRGHNALKLTGPIYSAALAGGHSAALTGRPAATLTNRHSTVPTDRHSAARRST